MGKDMHIPSDQFKMFCDDLCVRSKTVLKEASLTTFAEVIALTFSEFSKLPYAGNKTATEVKDELARLGFMFKPEEKVSDFLKNDPVVAKVQKNHEAPVKVFCQKTSKGPSDSDFGLWGTPVVTPNPPKQSGVLVKIKKVKDIDVGVLVISLATWKLEDLCAVAGAINTGAVELSVFKDMTMVIMMESKTKFPDFVVLAIQ